MSASDSGSGEFELTAEQVEVIAAGLYQLAACDGVDESGRELALIREFVEEAGYGNLSKGLAELPFDPATAFEVLDSSWLRKVFLEAALLVVKADGVVTDEERETFEWMAMAFGVAGGVDEIERQIQGVSL